MLKKADSYIGHIAEPPPIVILSEQRESKDLRMIETALLKSVRRSFDFGLRPALRMTAFSGAVPLQIVRTCVSVENGKPTIRLLTNGFGGCIVYLFNSAAGPQKEVLLC